APATAESIMASMRSVFARSAFRSIGFGMSVWQQATEYLMCSIRGFRLSADYANFTDRKIRDAWTDYLSGLLYNLFSSCLISVICVICGYHLVKTVPIDGT